MNRIRDYIINKINSNDSNKKLPSENHISKKFNVTRYEARKQYEMLEEMGIVITKQGIGRYANKNKPNINLELTGKSFTKKMLEQGIPLENINLGIKKIDDSRRFNEFKSDVYSVTRLRVLYGIPAAIHRSYVEIDKFPDLEENGDNISSIHDYYIKNGIKFDKVKDRILNVEFPTDEEIKILKCKSLVPLLVFRGKLLDENGEIIEYTETKYRNDIFTYSL